MKSRLFTDTQGLDASGPMEAGQLAVCLRMHAATYACAASEAAHRGLTTGQYLQALVERDAGDAASEAEKAFDSP